MELELNAQNIAELEKETIAPCATIYLPLAKTIKEKTAKSKIALENLIKAAEKKMIAAGSGKDYAEKFLKPAQTLSQDHFLWKTNAAGLAIFVAPPDILRYFKLAIAPKESVYVGKGFDTARLKRNFQNCSEFFVLAAGKNSLAFYRADCGKIEELKIGLPAHTRDFLPGRDPEKSIQGHGRAPIGKARIVHGQGMGKDSAKELLLKYFKMADKIIYRHLSQKNAPLIFAGDNGIFSIYRQANGYSRLMDDNLKGNFENEKKEAILEKSTQLLKNAAR